MPGSTATEQGYAVTPLQRIRNCVLTRRGRLIQRTCDRQPHPSRTPNTLLGLPVRAIQQELKSTRHDLESLEGRDTYYVQEQGDTGYIGEVEPGLPLHRSTQELPAPYLVSRTLTLLDESNHCKPSTRPRSRSRATVGSLQDLRD